MQESFKGLSDEPIQDAKQDKPTLASDQQTLLTLWLNAAALYEGKPAECSLLCTLNILQYDCNQMAAIRSASF